MVTAAPTVRTFPADWTLADLQAHLGVRADRIRLVPAPGTATEEDLIRNNDSKSVMLCELVDGVLVEKAVGWYESLIASLIVARMHDYLRARPIGMALGADGALKFLPHLIRIPDGCFISRRKLPKRKLPRRPVPALVPDLAIEVLSKGNTRREMRRKLREYFEAGVQVVWFVDPETRTATIFTAPDQSHQIDEHGTLDGATLLPGFTLRLREVLAEADRQASGDLAE